MIVALYFGMQALTLYSSDCMHCRFNMYYKIDLCIFYSLLHISIEIPTLEYLGVEQTIGGNLVPE